MINAYLPTVLFPFLRPDIPKPIDWIDYLDIAYEQKYFSNFGPLATLLADRMTRAYTQSDYTGILCSSNTAGLTAVLLALGMEGKKIALPDFTFAATIQAVFASGAIPVICDVDPDSWELDVASLRNAYQHHPDIACVIHVRPFGLIRDISVIRDFCSNLNIPLVIDSAAGLGMPDDNVIFGSDSGEVEVFSLHATKVFAIGEGGFICAPSSLQRSIKASMNFGFNPDRTYGNGINGKLDEFRAAIGLAMFDHISNIVPIRRRHAEAYMQFFSNYPQCKVAVEPGPTPWSAFPVIFDKVITDEVIGAFANSGIEIKRYYWPGTSKGYKGPNKFYSTNTTNSFRVQETCACFPIYSDYTAATGSLIAERIQQAMEMING